MISKIAQKLEDPEYRSAYVASQINIGIPFQLRALLKSRGKTQEWLAEKTGMLQPRISGLMTPGKTRPNIETLRRLADAFDCGLAVRFVPFSELAAWSEYFDPEGFSVPSFEDDLGFIERKEPAWEHSASLSSHFELPTSYYRGMTLTELDAHLDAGWDMATPLSDPSPEQIKQDKPPKVNNVIVIDTGAYQSAEIATEDLESLYGKQQRA